MDWIIDVHAHVNLGIGAQAKPKLVGRSDLTLERMLSLMDNHRIQACVLSVPESANFAIGQEASDLARKTNETLADIVSRYPTRFAAFATIPGQNIGGSIEEIGYALDVLKLDGVTTTTSINDRYLGDNLFDPVLQELNHRETTLFVHPTATEASKAVDLGLPRAILEFMFDTTRMLTNMVLSGAKKRYSKIKIITAHGGGTIPYLANRIEMLGARRNLDGRQLRLSEEEIREGLSSFYFDVTASTSKAQLDALLELVPTSRLLVGFDMPFMSETTIAPAIRDLKNHPGIDDDDRRMMLFDTARVLFPRLSDRLASKAGA